MARAVRFTKPEREIIRDAIRLLMSPWGEQTKGRQKAADSIIQKLEASEHPDADKVREYMTVRDAIAAFQGVLGRRLIIPPNGASLEFIRMQHRLKSLGLTREQCVTAATEAGKQWQGNIKAQSIINQAERLLQDADNTFPLNVLPGGEPTDDTMTDL